MCYIVSNALWIAYAIASHAPGLLVMQAGFTATSLYGIFKWLILKENTNND